MGDLQMIFVVESNSTCKSDWIYISMIARMSNSA